MGLPQYVPLLSSTSEKGDKLPAGLRSAVETLRPIVVKHGRMGNLSLLAGGFAILKGLAALRSSKGKALRQIAVGAGWIAIGRAQQQAGSEEIEVSEPWTSDDGESADEGESGVIADTNQQGPRNFGDPETGETPEGAGEEGEIAGPTSGDAVPETDKEGGPDGRADDIEMVDPDPDEANEGELQAEDGDDEE
jgi:hypothetical protein